MVKESSSKQIDEPSWDLNFQNIPIIKGSLTSFSCVKHRLVDAGDHLILIGRVLDFEVNPGTPLILYNGTSSDSGAKNPITKKQKYKL
jgi:flavin reductase (DIM6/NTAB) family NADH-FMN oxidoreductase RutF